MKKIGKFKKFLMILLSLVMLSSPVFVSGCFGDYNSSYNNQDNTDFPISGGGSGDTIPEEQEEQSKYPKENELSEDDYPNYFKNYRVTYKPSSVNRKDYDDSIKEQNSQVAEQIKTRLILANAYNNGLFSQTLSFIMVGDKYVSYKKTETDNTVTVSIDDDYISYFVQTMEELSFDNDKFMLAEALILSGHYLTSEDATQNTFASFYDPYKDSTNTEQISNTTDTYISQINHLGYTDVEIEQLTEYILRYIVGEENINADNELFYNAYYDVNRDEIVKITDSKYNRFLTDQTYFTDLVDKNGNPVECNDKLEGLMYYAGEYLKKSSQSKNFNHQELQGSISSNFVDASIGYEEGAEIGSAIYEKLIKTDYRTSFNANVWGYDQNGDGVADDVVKYKVGSQEYALFSVRLPGFKNYYNRVYFTVRDLLCAKVTDANREELDAQWQLDHPFSTGGYPYAEVFPSVPFSYFDDFNSSAMLIDEETGDITMKGSAYQSYQSFMVMPEQDVYLASAGIILMGPLDYDTEEIEMNLTVYIRYYDAETKSFALWNQNGETSEFYKVGDYTLPVNNPDDPYILIDEDECTLDDILSSAMINGTEKGDCFLPSFPQNEEVLTGSDATLITKNNYGYWFNYVSTPEGKQVVCFDGKSANSQSYLEYIFYTESDLPFMFSFFPAIAYSA